MDVREKLVDLIIDAKRTDPETGSFAEYLADHHIDNGVTAQEWISVHHKLPEAGGYVKKKKKRNPFSRFMPMVARIEKNGWVNPITEQYISEITHWMPIPQPPKGE